MMNDPMPSRLFSFSHFSMHPDHFPVPTQLTVPPPSLPRDCSITWSFNRCLFIVLIRTPMISISWYLTGYQCGALHATRVTTTAGTNEVTTKKEEEEKGV
jgi:hypothetical protein